jgi:NADPH:quinone reductase-like Zn-dependent oxidoreductase
MAPDAEIPSSMRVVLLEEYRTGLDAAIAGLRVTERPVPRPGRGEVLVRMEAAPVNPSDLMLLQGRYGVLKTLPSVPGWEGAGIVVESGGGLFARSLVGKRVACAVQSDVDGTWAQYLVTAARICIPLHRDVDLELGATSIVNPLTALGMFERIRRGGHTAAVQNAAVSQVGLMLARLCRAAGVPLIHVVRRHAQAERLRSVGEPHVLDSSQPGFCDELAELAARTQATIAFDAVAGEMTGILVGALPAGSTVVVYGALSEQACGGLDPIQLIFADKRVEAFYLGHWLQAKSLPGMMRLVRRGQSMMADGTLSSTIARRIPLNDLHAGLAAYVRDLSAGKALLLLR